MVAPNSPIESGGFRRVTRNPQAIGAGPLRPPPARRIERTGRARAGEGRALPGRIRAPRRGIRIYQDSWFQGARSDAGPRPTGGPSKAAKGPSPQGVDGGWVRCPRGLPDPRPVAGLARSRPADTAANAFEPDGSREEMERTYTRKDSGDPFFDIRPIDFPAGRYSSFRIDRDP